MSLSDNHKTMLDPNWTAARGVSHAHRLMQILAERDRLLALVVKVVRP